MRILLFIDSLGAGGAQRQLVGLAAMLHEIRHTVKVVTYYDHPFYLSILTAKGIDYECLSIKSTRCLHRLVRAIRAFHADWVISFQTNPNIMACLASLVSGVSLIVSERNTHLSMSLKDWIAFQLYRRASHVVPNSFTEKAYLDDHCPWLRKKTTAITNFVDLQMFQTDGRKSNSRTTRKLIVVASVKASKNTKTFIRAFQKAISEGCHLQVEWYGLNPPESDLPENVRYAKECIALVEDLGVGEHFKLLPKVSNIQEKYWDADIFCLPSHFEGTPNALCEAMAASLPVVCSRVCDNARFVAEGENGMLFDQTSIDDMARVLKAVGDMPLERIEAWGRKSRETAERLCSEQMFLDQYIKLLES